MNSLFVRSAARRMRETMLSRFSASLACICLCACLCAWAGACLEAETAAGLSVPPALEATPDTRLRLLIETDAGGDPDDEQSLVRFLLCANEWDVEGIIANRPEARAGENRNEERTGLGIVRRLLGAYRQCHTNLARHDPRYPTPEALWARAVPGYDDTEEGVRLILAAADSADPRPLWYSDWGSDRGSATNNLRRALDRVLRERGPGGYAAFKSRLRLSSYDAFGGHTARLEPPFPLWVNTFAPEISGRRWYHRFSALTATAGGFDLARDALAGHGPLGALYPANTGPRQKEGDTMTFLYLFPTGMNDPERPHWGSWAGRYGPNEAYAGKPYYWANQQDAWRGATNRDNTLGRWAEALQNDFRARLDWCVRPPAEANHPPRVRVDSPLHRIVRGGESIRLSAAASSDPDGDALTFEWAVYPEPGTYRGAISVLAEGPLLGFEAPPVTSPETVHWIVAVTDRGSPPLTRYRRIVCTVLPRAAEPAEDGSWQKVKSAFEPPDRPEGEEASLRSLFRFDNGREVQTAADWAERRAELLESWHAIMGPWPPLLERPRLDVLGTETRENLQQRRVRIEIAAGQTGEGWLLLPAGRGPFPAVLVVYYEPETSVGLNPKQSLRDFGLELARRGFVTLSLGTPGGNAWKPELGAAQCQPLSYHAYVAANAWRALASLAEVDPGRIGVVGHSYGGKWALFAGALWDRFAAVAVSDPGIVWDESRPNVNYWEPWYLGRDATRTRQPGVPTEANPRTGAYARLVAQGRDLHEVHALIAPRPFLVSGGSEDPPERWRALNHTVAVHRLLGVTNRVGMTNRATHAPTRESNEQIYAFFEVFLRAKPSDGGDRAGAPASLSAVSANR